MRRHAYVMPTQLAPGAPVAPVAPATTPGSPPLPPTQPVQLIDPVFPWAYAPLQDLTTVDSKGFPPYFKMVTSLFPSTREIALSCQVPLGLVVSPALVSGVPVIDGRVSGCPRCSACLAYVCPLTRVSPDGRVWKCALCGKDNQVPLSDPVPFPSRQELLNRVYDVIAPDNYINKDSGPVLMFVLDMSYKAWTLGFTQQMIATIKASLDSVPGHYRVGLMTMSDKITVFDLGHQSEIVIADIFDCALGGSIQNILPHLSDCKDTFIRALDELMTRVPTDPMKGNCLGSAYVVLARTLLTVGGVVIIGCVGLPTHGPYVLKPRSPGEDGEVGMLRLPKDGSGKVYRETAFNLNRAGVSVHLFTAGTEFSDLATIAVPPGLTCGSVSLYGAFSDDDKQRLHADIFGRMTDLYVWESSLRLRCSKGIKILKQHANCTLKNELVSFPVLARNDAVGFEFTIEGPLSSDRAVFQLAMVFTDSDKRRMIRVFTFDAQVTNDANAICRSIDEGALTTIMTRRAVALVLQKGSVVARNEMLKQIHSMFLRGTQFGAVFHLMHAMLVSDIFRNPLPGGIDERMSLLIRLRSIALKDLLLFLYPRMFVTDADCQLVPLNSQAFGVGSCILVHALDAIYVWISSAVSPDYLQKTFGVSNIADVPAEVPVLTTQENTNLRALFDFCWNFSGRYLPVEIMTQGDPREAIFGTILRDEGGQDVLPLSEWMKQMRPSVGVH